MSTTPLQHPERTIILSCATVIEEMMPLIPSAMNYQVFDFGLHLVPGNLKKSLQEAIDTAGKSHDTVILGYGLCAMAVVGLQARECTLVVPKVDDCIAIFLGSGAAYSKQTRVEPGTYYLTKGWIEVSDTLLDEYKRVLKKYGQERADYIMDEMLKHYKRLVYINTGTENQEKYRAYAREVANQFNLRFEEIIGSNKFIKKMVAGNWDDEFLIVPPGSTVQYNDFSDYKAGG